MCIGLTSIILTFTTNTMILGYGDLSVNKNTAQYRTVIGCSACDAINAVDRNISTCTRTEFGQTSPDHFTWWYVDLGAVHSVYNIRIQFRDYGQMYTRRQRGRFAGFSLYVSNSTDRQSKYLCYKDGPELPPLDFNANCTKYGRYVIFYNERLIGTNYSVGYETSNVVTDLCEVTVTGCSGFGVYGSHCDLRCPENCKERRCDIINGTCFGCTPGWVGEYCSIGCSPGYYGLECKLKCIGHCKDNEPCNHINGECDNGCSDGWTGENCTEECPTGKYGSDCGYNCSRHCTGDISCNRTTGRCDSGCKPGYTGELCDTGCKNGMYGRSCRYYCSENCLHNVPCNSTNGHCDSGCASGYLDFFCNKTCDLGTYGLDCKQNCSVDCKDGLCNNVDGSCICTNAKNGSPFCSDTNLQSNECNESFYITGMSILVIITIILGAACILLFWKYKRLVKIVRSSHYTFITRTSLQPENSDKDGPQYEELHVSENSYNNTELRTSTQNQQV